VAGAAVRVVLSRIIHQQSNPRNDKYNINT
jgi:hypothetical protein